MLFQLMGTVWLSVMTMGTWDLRTISLKMTLISSRFSCSAMATAYRRASLSLICSAWDSRLLMKIWLRMVKQASSARALVKRMYLMFAREREVNHPRSLRRGGRSWKKRVGKERSDAMGQQGEKSKCKMQNEKCKMTDLQDEWIWKTNQQRAKTGL